MTVSAATTASLARQLDEAASIRRPIAPFAAALRLTLADAYAIQRAGLDHHLAAGRRLAGYKVGFTAASMQRLLGTSGPVFGAVLDDRLYADGTDLPARFLTPRIEIELAMVVGRSIAGPGRSLAEVLGAIDHAVPALEIVDNRIGPPPTAADIVADNAGCGGILLGGCPVRPDAIDPTRTAAMLSINGVVEESGLSAAVLGHPARAVVALLDHLATYGEGLVAGQVISTGAFTAPVPVTAGDVIHADFGPLGSISTRFP